MSDSATRTAQRLPSYLPAIYRDQPFLGRYLWAFEQVLLDLEQSIGNIATLFDPAQTREDFLPWLSSWVAFTLRADLEPNQQRAFLARIVSLYRRRGTKQNLQDLLSIFTRGVPTIAESDDTGPAHYFRITMRLPRAAAEVQLRQTAIAHALIDLEKPAHTFYDLDLLFPTMQIGVSSTIGIDTLLGTGGDDQTGGAAAPNVSTAAKQTVGAGTPKQKRSAPRKKKHPVTKTKRPAPAKKKGRAAKPRRK